MKTKKNRMTTKRSEVEMMRGKETKKRHKIISNRCNIMQWDAKWLKKKQNSHKEMQQDKRLV